MLRRLLLIVTCLAAAACYSRGDPVAPRPYLEQHHPDVVRVGLRDSSTRIVYSPQISGDSLLGHAGDSSIVQHRPNTRVAIPLSSVRFISVPSTRPVGSTMLLLGAFLGLMIILIENSPTYLIGH